MIFNPLKFKFFIFKKYQDQQFKADKKICDKSLNIISVTPVDVHLQKKARKEQHTLAAVLNYTTFSSLYYTMGINITPSKCVTPLNCHSHLCKCIIPMTKTARETNAWPVGLTLHCNTVITAYGHTLGRQNM